MTHSLAVSVMVVGMLVAAEDAQAAPRKPAPHKATAAKKQPKAAATPGRPAAAAGEELARDRQGNTHVGFGEHVVSGQFATKGGVYVVERKEPELRSLMARRKDFRTEIEGSIK